MFENKYTAATSQLQDLIRAHPQDAKDHASYALVLNYQTKQKPALDEALKAQKLAPKDGFVLTVLTRVEDWNNDLPSAARDGAAAVKAGETGEVALLAQGSSGARAAYKAGCKREPRGALDRKMLGEFAVAVDKDATAAAKDERAAISAEPTDDEAGAYLVAVLR